MPEAIGNAMLDRFHLAYEQLEAFSFSWKYRSQKMKSILKASLQKGSGFYAGGKK